MPNLAVRAAGEAMPAAKKITTTLHPDEFPPEYAMICDGTCLEPVYPDGTKLMFSRDAAYRPGDFVMLFKRPELVAKGEHQMVVKKLILAPGHRFWREGNHDVGNIRPVVIVEMLNPRRTLYANPLHLLGIHKCIGPVPADRGTTQILSDEDVRREYPRRRA